MADEPGLQAAFGQSGSQRKGCGFPVAKFLALFDLATGMLLRVEPAPLRSQPISRRTPAASRMRQHAVPAAPRPLTTTLIASSFLPTTFKALMSAANSTTGLVGFYVSADAGEHWRLAINTPNASGGAPPRVADNRPLVRIGGGDLPTIVVDPKNESVVYSSSTVFWRTEDGGLTWTAVRGAPGGVLNQREERTMGWRWLAAASLLVLILASCAHQPPPGGSAPLPGFLLGLLHGYISLFSLIASLFFDVRIYDYPNNGFFYDLGFIVGRDIFLRRPGHKRARFLNLNGAARQFGGRDHLSQHVSIHIVRDGKPLQIQDGRGNIILRHLEIGHLLNVRTVRDKNALGAMRSGPPQSAT